MKVINESSSMSDYMNIIRDAINDEATAIDLYDKILTMNQLPAAVRPVIEEIRDDEKDHMVLLTNLLQDIVEDEMPGYGEEDMMSIEDEDSDEESEEIVGGVPAPQNISELSECKNRKGMIIEDRCQNFTRASLSESVMTDLYLKKILRQICDKVGYPTEIRPAENMPGFEVIISSDKMNEVVQFLENQGYQVVDEYKDDLGSDWTLTMMKDGILVGYSYYPGDDVVKFFAVEDTEEMESLHRHSIKESDENGFDEDDEEFVDYTPKTYQVSSSMPSKMGDDEYVNNDLDTDDPAKAIKAWFRVGEKFRGGTAISTHAKKDAQKLIDWAYENQDKIKEWHEKFKCPYKLDFMLKGIESKHNDRCSGFYEDPEYDWATDMIFPFDVG